MELSAALGGVGEVPLNLLEDDGWPQLLQRIAHSLDIEQGTFEVYARGVPCTGVECLEAGDVLDVRILPSVAARARLEELGFPEGHLVPLFVRMCSFHPMTRLAPEDTELLRLVLQAGVEERPFEEAVRHGSIHAAALLLGDGADPDAPARGGGHVLNLCPATNRPVMAQLFSQFTSNADVTCKLPASSRSAVIQTHLAMSESTHFAGQPVMGTPVGHTTIVSYNDFSHSLCGCAEDLGLTCDVFLCAPCMVGRLCDSVAHGVPNSMNIPVCAGLVGVSLVSTLLWVLTSPYGVFFCIFPYIPMSSITCSLRTRLRREIGLLPSDGEDCLVSFLCTPCAVCQMTREQDSRGVPPGHCICSADRSVVVVHSTTAQPYAQPAYGTGAATVTTVTTSA